MQIQQIMSTDVTTIAPDSTLQQAASLMREHQIGALPVVDQSGQVAGMVTDRDIVLRSVAMGGSADQSTVGQVMSSPAITVAPQEDVEDAAGLMARYGIRRLPVVERGALVGMVSMGDYAYDTSQCDQATRLMHHLSRQQPGGGPKRRG